MQKSMKYYYILSYMLKPSHLLAQGFENNRTAQEKLFRHMCNFWEWAEWREGRRVVGYYLDVDTTKDQLCLINTTPLDCISGYIMDGSVCDSYLNRLPHRRLNFIEI